MSDQSPRNDLEKSRQLLDAISHHASGDPGGATDDFCAIFLALLDEAESSQGGPEETVSDAAELTAFLLNWLSEIHHHIGDGPSLVERLRQASAEASQRWPELLETAEFDSFSPSDSDPWYGEADDGATQADGDGEHENEPDVAVPSAEEIGQLIAGLAGSGIAPKQAETSPPAAPPPVAPPAMGDHCDDPIDQELYEAFLEDAHGCIGSIEEASFQLESDPERAGPLQQICRELHTLKGASGSVGLTSLAEYLHGVEDALRDDDRGPAQVTSDFLFECLDTIRKQLGIDESSGRAADSAHAPADPAHAPADSPKPSAAPAPPSDPAGAPPPTFHADGDSSAHDPSVRVKASQLNRLMDMLAELVMLRNRRDTELSELQDIHQELLHSVSRMRSLGDGTEFQRPAIPAAETAGEALDGASGSLTEIANDILEVASQLRDCYQPVADENQAVSSFIRQFRQELVELRRVPVSGLFRRLQRVIRDAARAEGKQVELRLVGEDVGIERLLQERLYEPLLHIVRNAVSHGIEDAEQRRNSGKSPTGQLTLKARSSSDLLRIEICDDGRGLDYGALRRRGLELGLLKRDAVPSRDELSQLIFHPGFSTRGSTSQVSGRGVGMDVVAETLQRMRGWVEVDSLTGRGTTVRLTFPLPSVIQHMMVFRAGDQLFALPMQSVYGAGEGERELLGVGFSELFGGDRAGSDPPGQRLVLGGDAPSSDADGLSPRRVALWVDEIVGPEEVVVRPMPALLKHHPLCCGASLSGMGDVVLVLDPHRLAELAIHRGQGRSQLTPSAIRARQRPQAEPPVTVLVVDDSLSARKRLVRSLKRYDVEIVEASDGLEALELLKTHTFSAVFSDLEMPRMDGLQLLNEVRQKELHKPATWVIISSRTEQALRQQAAASGASGYLGKPFADEALDEMLAAAGPSRLNAPPAPLFTPSCGETP